MPVIGRTNHYERGGYTAGAGAGRKEPGQGGAGVVVRCIAAQDVTQAGPSGRHGRTASEETHKHYNAVCLSDYTSYRAASGGRSGRLLSADPRRGGDGPRRSVQDFAELMARPGRWLGS